MSGPTLLYPIASGLLSKKPVPGINDPALVLASEYDRDTQAMRAEIAGLIEARDNRVHQRLAVIDSLEVERDALRAQVEAMRKALNHILAMQTRGFIMLGDNATSMANDALQVEP